MCRMMSRNCRMSCNLSVKKSRLSPLVHASHVQSLQGCTDAACCCVLSFVKATRRLRQHAGAAYVRQRGYNFQTFSKKNIVSLFSLRAEFARRYRANRVRKARRLLNDSIDSGDGSFVKRFNTQFFTASLGNVLLHSCLGPPEYQSSAVPRRRRQQRQQPTSESTPLESTPAVTIRPGPPRPAGSDRLTGSGRSAAGRSAAGRQAGIADSNRERRGRRRALRILRPPAIPRCRVRCMQAAGGGGPFRSVDAWPTN